MKTAKERYEDFIKNFLTPFLKTKGFKKKGNKYILYGEELAYVFYFLRGDFNNKDFIDFSFDFEIYTQNFEDKKELTTYLRPLISANTSYITNNPSYSWVTIKSEDTNAEEKDRKLREFLPDAIEKQILPYMLQFKTVQDVIHLLETTPENKHFFSVPTSGYQTVIKVAHLYWLMGRKQDAIRVLDEGIANIKKIIKAERFWEESSEDFKSLKDRIKKGGDFYARENQKALI